MAVEASVRDVAPGVRDQTGQRRSSVPLPNPLESSDLVMVVTPPRVIDWDAVFRDAASSSTQ